MDTLAGAEHMTHCNSSRSGSPSITLNCSDGTESSLQRCNPQLVRNSICSCTDGVLEPHAKVICKKGMLFYIFYFGTSDDVRSCNCICQVCSDGEMRLVEGSTHREGIVEVCVDGRWRTVSNNSNGIAGPGEVCNKLGFPAEGTCIMLIHWCMQQYPLSIMVFRCCSNFKTGNVQ